MCIYHYPDEINLGRSGDIVVTEISVISNTSKFTCMVTCPVWGLALVANSIIPSAKVRRMASENLWEHLFVCPGGIYRYVPMTS